MPQTQLPTYRRMQGHMIDYTPGAAVYAGDVVLLGNMVAVAPLDIPANVLGAVAIKDVFRGPKDASVFAAGDGVYWNPSGNPTGGTAGTGCFTSSGTSGYLAGVAVMAQLTGDATVDVYLCPEALASSARGASTVSIGASTAAAGTTTADAGVLPAGTAGFYPTTGADGTKGVRIHAADKVTGRQLLIGNGTAAAVLKVYPPSGGTINGAAADAAFSSAAGKGVTVLCLSAAANTWSAW